MQRTMRKLPIYILVTAGAVLFMIPFVWTVSTALKTRQQVYASPPQWIPRTYRVADAAGKLQPVTVVTRIDKPAAVVKLLNGPRTGQVVPVERAALERAADGQLTVQLRAPAPFAAKLLKDMPGGLAQVRFSDSGVEQYVAPAALRGVVDPQWGNFTKVWADLDHGGMLPLSFGVFVLNTYTITIINIIGTTISCSLVAYGFARFRFRGRNVLFLLLLSTMMLPSQVTMIPVYMIWMKAGLVDTFAPLTIPSFFAQNAFFVFLLRQFFLGIPRELDEAAMIDGAGPLRIWWQILMPLSKPAIATVAVLGFIAHWDDFMGPLIYLNRLENYTVSIALRLFQDQSGTDFNLLMAAALVHIIPVVLLFFLAQRHFVKSMALSGLKG